MGSQKKCAAVKEKIPGDMRGGHAKNQDRNEKGQFCRMPASDGVPPCAGEASATGGRSKGKKVSFFVGDGSASGSWAKGGGRVDRCVGEGSIAGGRSNRGKVSASIGARKASDSRDKGGGRVAPSVGGTGEESDSDDKGKKVYVTKTQISNLVCLGSSSSEDVETNGNTNESLMDAYDEYFWPQISTSEDTSGNKDSTGSGSKEAKETSEEGVDHRNSAFHQPSNVERVAHRKRKVELNKMTNISNKKPRLQKKKKKKKKKKKVNMTSELEILKSRVDVHDESIEDIELQLAVLADKVLAMEGEDNEVEPTKTNKIRMKKGSLQKKKMVNTASELKILKRQIDMHDDSIVDIKIQLRVLIDKVNALEFGDSEDDTSSDSE